jgi:hypothetical protein
MIDLLLDPEKALDAIDKATKLVKRAMATSNDIAGIGKALGVQIQARVNAETALAAAKSGNVKGNAFQLAADLELAIHKAKQDEEHLKNTVFYPNHMDLWMQIKATEANIRKGQIQAAKDAKAAAKRKKEQQDEIVEWVVVGVFGVALLGAMLWGGFELLMWCKKTGCGG